MKYWTEYLALRGVTAPLSVLPRNFALAVGRAIGRGLNAILGSRQKIAAENLRKSFPGISEAEVRNTIRGCWENLGAGAAEFTQLPAMSDDELQSIAEFQGLDLLKKSIAKGKGVIILTGHYGAWELGTRFWPHAGLDMAVVARRVKNPLVNAWVTRVRSSHGVRVILARNAVRETIQWLKKGKVLGILIDHRVVEGGLKIPFFGRPAYTSSLPALLALRYEAPIHPVHCWREGEKVKIHVAAAMDFSGLETREEDLAEATLRMNRVVEGWVRERPAAWLWIHNRWKGGDS